MLPLARAVALLPWRSLAWLGALLGLFAGSILRIRRAHVERAMRRAGIALPRAAARAMYASLGTAIFEFLWMVGRRGDLGGVVGLSERAGAVLRGLGVGARGAKGIVIATAHTGNWDLVACAAAEEHLALTVLTKRLRVAWLDRFWQGSRAERGIELVSGPNMFAEAVRALAAGRSVAVLVDQAPERSSAVTSVRFLGATARCDRMAALIAARAGVPLVLALGRRETDGRHVVDIPLVARPPSAKAAGRDWVSSTTREVAVRLEAFVRESPSQWLWMHRRWKGFTPARAAAACQDRAEKLSLSA
ncbi:MAG TPA: lysophospholipid acyltransferase family protein [Polyangiaceae bacterium]|nr:lysophospholipid acyltransferase family protein [Polyangiaceae bacterium]